MRAVNPQFLTITGQRRTGRIVVSFDDEAIALTADQFDTLVVLAYRRRVSETGWASLRDFGVDDPQHLRTKIWRLRKSLDSVLGRGAGSEIVRSGLKNEYSLRLPASAIRFDTSCRELPGGLVSVPIGPLITDARP